MRSWISSARLHAAARTERSVRRKVREALRLLVIGKDGEIKISIGEEDSATLALVLVQQLHLKNVHVKRCELPGIFSPNGQMANLRHRHLQLDLIHPYAARIGV